MSRVMTKKQKQRISEYIEYLDKQKSVLNDWLDGKESLSVLCATGGLSLHLLRRDISLFASREGKETYIPDELRGKSHLLWGRNEYVYYNVFDGLDIYNKLSVSLSPKELDETVDLALSVLTDKQKEYLLYRAKGYKYDQIAQEQGCSRQAVHTCIRLGVEALRRSDFAKSVLKAGKKEWEKGHDKNSVILSQDLFKMKNTFPVLARHKILRSDDLIGKSREELLSYRGLGKKRLADIEAVLPSIGLAVNERGLIYQGI